MRAAIVVLSILMGVAPARSDDAAGRTAAERHFRIGEKAYKILPLPEIAFTAAQAYRRQYRLDPRLELARRAVELYTLYLGKIKKGAHVGTAIDSLDTMEREVEKLTAAGAKVAAALSVERTTIVVFPELATEGKGDGTIREIAELPDAEVAKIVTLLDGKPVAPFEKIDVTPGPHKIRVEAEGYLPAESSERAVQGVSTIAGITLVPRPAKVTVQTEAGARIRIDGRPAGTAPLTGLELPAGRHVMTISRDGRETIARELTVTRGQEVTLREPLRKTTRRKLVPWIVGGAGVLAVITGSSLVAAIVYDGRASDRLGRIETEGDQTPADAAEYRDLVEMRDTLVTGTWITGGAMLLVGGLAAALYWGDTPSDDNVRVVPAVMTGGGSVSLGGWF